MWYEGDNPHDPAYIIFGPPLSAGMPEMPVTLYDRGVALKPLDGTEVWARIMAPYYNKHWDGEHGFLYLPPDRVTEQAAVTMHGSVVQISHPIFTSYYKYGPIPMRQLLANVLAAQLPSPMVKAPTLPSFARVTVTSQTHRRMVHVLAYVPERRGASTDMIEEPVTLQEITVALRLDGRSPRRVYLAPTMERLPFTIDVGYIITTLPVVAGYAMVVFDEE